VVSRGRRCSDENVKTPSGFIKTNPRARRWVVEPIGVPAPVCISSGRWLRGEIFVRDRVRILLPPAAGLRTPGSPRRQTAAVTCQVTAPETARRSPSRLRGAGTTFCAWTRAWLGADQVGGASAPGDMKKRIQRRHGLLTWVSLAARPRHFFPTRFDSVSEDDAALAEQALLGPGLPHRRSPRRGIDGVHCVCHPSTRLPS
jgi:hypothetical protein